MTEVLLFILVVMNLAWIITKALEKRKEVHGYIVAFDDGNMYLELADKDTIDTIRNSEYVTFEVVKAKDTRE